MSIIIEAHAPNLKKVEDPLFVGHNFYVDTKTISVISLNLMWYNFRMYVDYDTDRVIWLVDSVITGKDRNRHFV